MATVSTPARQPFGVLDDSKLRSLQSIKNRQNAITPSSVPNLKRRAPSPELSDSENVDPYLIDSGSKRKRAAFDDDVSIAKQSRTYAKVVPPSTKIYTPPTSTTYTPRLDAAPRQISIPFSAPAAAGRSPTRPHSKYDKSQPRRRFAPPSLGTTSPSVSIAAALRGTLAHKKTTRTKKANGLLSEAQPKSWSFEIFEESEEQQDYRMSEWTMTQSSAALDLSGDEAKSKSFDGTVKADKGKENIDPNEMAVVSAPITRAATAAAAALVTAEEKQNEIKTGEPRTPLGDLNAVDFYAEGLDATSVVLVHDDVPQEDSVNDGVQKHIEEVSVSARQGEASPVLVAVPAVEDFALETCHEPQVNTELDAAPEQIPEWTTRTSLSLAVDQQQQESSDMPALSDESVDIEIWESESAKDENENDEDQFSSHVVVVREGNCVSLSGPCLQEL